MTPMRFSLPLSLGLAGAAALLGTDALAAGFATAKFGGEHGNPTTDNPTAIYYNPAGIALSQGIRIFADGNIAFRSVTYDRRPDPKAPGEVPEPADAQGANTGRASLFNVVAAPMVGLTAGSKVSDSVGLAGGLAFFVPFGGTAVWDKNDAFKDHPKYPGAVDGTQRYYAIHGTIRTIYVSGALALNIKNKFSLGVSGGVALNDIDSLRARSASASSDLDLEGRSWFKGKALTPQLGGGFVITPLDTIDKLRIGFSYQASPGFGEMKVKGTLTNFFGSKEAPLDLEVHQTLPDVFRLGVSFRPLDTVEVRIFGDYTRWSLFQNQCFAKAGDECKVNSDGSDAAIRDENGQEIKGGVATVTNNLVRRWRDSGGVRVGASFWVRKPLELFVGAGYDSSAVPDSTLEPSLIDFHSLSTAFGLRGQMHKNLAGAISYTHYFFVPRDITGKAEHFVTPSNGVDTGGTYKQNIGVLNINLMASFDPFTRPAPAPQPAAPSSL
jgi:long-chain fatty acid transport protein